MCTKANGTDSAGCSLPISVSVYCIGFLSSVKGGIFFFRILMDECK